MMKLYLTDNVIIIRTENDEWGVITEVSSPNTPARVEDTNTLILDANGKEVVGNMLVILDSNIKITYGDKIMIKNKNGEVFDQPDKKFQIKKIEKAGMRKRNMIYVWI